MALAKIWRNRIIAGTKTFMEVPTVDLKNKVKTLLKQDVTNGVITETQYKEFTGEDYTA